MSQKGKLKNGIIAVAGLALIVGVTFAVLRVKRDPVRIAIVDTGIDLQKNPQLKVAVDQPESAPTDAAGHGTQVALEVFARCPECKIIPIQISASGGGIQIPDLTRALEESVKRGANVVNFSFGITFPPNEAPAHAQEVAALRAAVTQAQSQNVVLVAAAGLGVPNPFRPLPLTDLFPHSLGGLIVVGAARGLDAADPLSNFGPLLDLVVLQPDAPQAGFLNSSIASAQVAGVIGKFISKSLTHFTPAKIKELLKKSAQPASPKLAAEDRDRMGAGAFDIQAFLNSF